MERYEAFKRVKIYFETIAQGEERISLLSKEGKIIAASDESEIGKFISEATRVLNRQRRRIVNADRGGQMKDIRPIIVEDIVYGAYVIAASAQRLSRLEVLIDDYFKENFTSDDLKERSIVALDLDSPVPYLQQKTSTEKKKNHSSKSSRRRKKTALVEAPVLIKEFAYLLTGEISILLQPQLLQELSRYFPNGETTLEPSYLLICCSTPVDLSVRELLERFQLKLFCSYGFEKNRKKAALKALKALAYTPDVIEDQGIIFFDVNRSKAMIVLAYLDHPDLYFDDIARLHELERDKNLFNTFSEFIASNFSVKNTCERLLVHRNTICYRLKKIGQILHRPIVENNFSYQLYSLFILSSSFNKTLLPDVTKNHALNSLYL